MTPTALYLARVASGLVLSLFSAVFFIFILLALIDPVGAMAADDPDPHGTPPSRVSSLILCVASAAPFLFGIFLVALPPALHKAPTQPPAAVPGNNNTRAAHKAP